MRNKQKIKELEMRIERLEKFLSTDRSEETAEKIGATLIREIAKNDTAASDNQ